MSRLTFAGVQVEDIYPYPLPDLFAGNQLIVAGRYRDGGPADLDPDAARSNGRAQTYTYRDLTFAERGGQRVHRPAVGAAQDRLSADADPAARCQG